MKGAKKHFSRALTLLLSVLIMLQTVTVPAFAAENATENVEVATNDASTEEESTFNLIKADVQIDDESKRDSRLRTAGRETHCAPQSPRALRLRYSYGGTQYPPNPCADTHIPAFRIYPHAHPKRNILITGTM